MASDSFTGTNGAAPGSGWTALGSPWEIFNNSVRPTDDFETTPPARLRRNEAAFPANQYIQARVKFSSATIDFPQNGISIRTDASGNGYNALLSSSGVTLNRGNAGTYVADNPISGLVADTFYLMRIEATGTTIRVLLDTGGGLVERINVTDATYASGNPMLRSVTGSLANMLEFDDAEWTDPSGQIEVPISDVSNAGAWTTSPLFDKLDEVSASDADFISSPSAPANAACVLGMASATDPAVSTGHILRVRHRKAAAGSHRMDLVYRLLQGGTQIASFTATDIGTAWTTVEQTLTAPQADAITNYSNLRVELSANKVVSTPSAPTFVAAGTVVSGLAAITPGMPAGILANDILLLYVESAAQPISLSTAAGFVEVPGSPQTTGTAAGTAATRLAVFWKRAVGGDTAPTVADSGDHQIARIMAIRGCKTTGDPWNVTPTGDVAGVAATAVTIPGATTTVDNCMLVQAVANATDTTTAQTGSWTNAGLTTLTERMDNNTTQGNGGGFGVVTGIRTTAGATGSTTATLATSSVQARHCIALEPAAVIDTTCDVSWVQLEIPNPPSGGGASPINFFFVGYGF